MNAAIAIQIPARLEYLGVLRGAVHALAQVYPAAQRPGDERLRAWALAIHEAAANIVAHGGGGPIRLKIEPQADRVVFWLEDEGPPNPLPELVPDALDEHGRGLQLIRMLMDELHYVREGAHNQLQLAARLS